MDGPVLSATRRVLKDIAAERDRQDAKWGPQDHPNGTGPREPIFGRLCYADDAAKDARSLCDGEAAAGRLNWRLILEEEVHEAYAESDPVRLREELVQSAAVIAAWIENIDRDRT